MHTIKVMFTGIGLLALCTVAGRRLGGEDRGTATGAAIFVPLWLIGTGINLYGGVKQGYTVRDELPVAMGVFAVPALVAGALWRSQRHG